MNESLAPPSPERAASMSSATPSANGTTRAVVRGGSYSALGQVLTLAASLIATPFVIRLLGPEQYGLLTLLNILIGYVLLADLGMSVASTKFATDAHAKAESPREAAVVWTAFALGVVPSATIALILWFFAGDIAVGFLRLDGGSAHEATVSLRIASVGFFARAIGGIFNTPQLVRMRWDLNVAITSGGATVQVLIVPVVLALGGGLIEAVLASTAVGIATTALHVAVSSRLQPLLWPPSFDAALIRPLARFGGLMVMSHGTFLVLTNIDRFVIARVESVTEVAYYAVAAAAAAVLNIMPYAVAQPLLPGFSLLLAKDERAEARAMYVTLLRIMALALIPAVAVLFVVARPFFEVWAGPAYADHSTVPFLILVVGVAANAFGTVPGNVLMAADRVSVMARYHVVQLIPYLAVTVVFVATLGPVGAAMAWAGRAIVTAALYLRVTKAVVPPDPASERRRLAPYLTAAVILGTPAAAIFLASPPLVLGAAVMTVALTAYVVFVWARLLSVSERALIRRLVPGSRVTEAA
jgi:O-antigen/teichoic acid export membrane protein